jgi:hypothetical protein
MNVRPATSAVISKVAFALQDLVANDDLENISEVEKESDSPFFLAIAAAVRKEARTGDPEYARSGAGNSVSAGEPAIQTVE